MVIWFVSSPRGLARVCFLFLVITLISTFSYKALRVEAEKIPHYFGKHPLAQVAFTFETTWSEGVLSEILTILEEENVQATFFLTGNWIENFPGESETILKKGHEMGNHSYSHRSFLTLSEENINAELNRFKEIAEENLGLRPRLFRPPFGEYNALTVDIADSMGYQTVLWSIESYDYLSQSGDEILERVMEKLHYGAIINFRTGSEKLPRALTQIIHAIRKEGYEIIKVSELIQKR